MPLTGSIQSVAFPSGPGFGVAVVCFTNEMGVPTLVPPQFAASFGIQAEVDGVQFPVTLAAGGGNVSLGPDDCLRILFPADENSENVKVFNNTGNNVLDVFCAVGVKAPPFDSDPLTVGTLKACLSDLKVFRVVEKCESVTFGDDCGCSTCASGCGCG